MLRKSFNPEITKKNKKNKNKNKKKERKRKKKKRPFSFSYRNCKYFIFGHVLIDSLKYKPQSLLFSISAKSAGISQSITFPSGLIKFSFSLKY